MEGVTKVMLLRLADRRLPPGPWHELFGQESWLTETVMMIRLSMDWGTSTGCWSLASERRRAAKLLSAVESLWAGRIGRRGSAAVGGVFLYCKMAVVVVLSNLTPLAEE